MIVEHLTSERLLPSRPDLRKSRANQGASDHPSGPAMVAHRRLTRPGD